MDGTSKIQMSCCQAFFGDNSVISPLTVEILLAQLLGACAMRAPRC
jgi:hypothetical protein